jgi:hypothetical protein
MLQALSGRDVEGSTGDGGAVKRHPLSHIQVPASPVSSLPLQQSISVRQKHVDMNFKHPSYLPLCNTIKSYSIHSLKSTRTCASPHLRNMTTTSTNQRVSRLYDDQPAFIYGTAWKKDQTKRLVKEALKAGFRRVDTAAQPRHYQEALVGEALRETFTGGVLNRKELYVHVHFPTY